MNYREQVRRGMGRPIADIQQQPQQPNIAEMFIEKTLKPKVKNYLNGMSKMDDVKTDLVNHHAIYDLLKQIYNLKDNNYSPSVYGPVNLRGIMD